MKNDVDIDRLLKIEAIAKEISRIPCHCDYCWTSRNRHNPRGCTWEDTKILREILESDE